MSLVQLPLLLPVVTSGINGTIQRRTDVKPFPGPGSFLSRATGRPADGRLPWSGLPACYRGGWPASGRVSASASLILSAGGRPPGRRSSPTRYVVHSRAGNSHQLPPAVLSTERTACHLGLDVPLRPVPRVGVGVVDGAD